MDTGADADVLHSSGDSVTLTLVLLTLEGQQVDLNCQGNTRSAVDL